MKKIIKTIREKMKYMSAFICLFLMMGSSAFAAEPTIVSGTKALIKDTTAYLLGGIASVAVLCTLFTGYQWYIAAEEEKPKFKKRAMNIIGVGIGLICAAGTIAWVFSHYLK